MEIDSAIRSKRILTPQGFLAGTVWISKGKIAAVNTSFETEFDAPILDVGDEVVMPGLIDPHVHINEPGRTNWEGFDTATRAAAAGGITSLIDMPLNSSPVTTTFSNLQLKIASARTGVHVNCGFWGGVVPFNISKLDDLIIGGVFGMKTFLTHSGIDEFPETNPSSLKEVLLQLKQYGIPLLVHAELSDDHDGITNLKIKPGSYRAYLNSRPRTWENNAIESMIQLCRETGARVHIVHLSSSDALPSIRKARKEGLPLTVETAPHYLFFNAEEIEDKNTLLKCAPPIRERENNEKLWQALIDGDIDFIATDHSPAPPDLKEIESGNFEKAWGGIAGLQFSLPAVWTAGKKYGISAEDIVRWMCLNPAIFLNLNDTKGKIETGYDADLVIWNPEKEFTLYSKDIFHKHKQTPYSGLKLSGKVKMTMVNGEVVFRNDQIIKLNAGKILIKKTQPSLNTP